MQEVSDKPKRSWVKRVTVVFFVLPVIAIVGWYGYGYYWSAQIRGELQRIKDSGQPMSFAELAAGRPALDSPDNAGLVYEQAVELVIERDIDLFECMEKLSYEDMDGNPRTPSEEDIAEVKVFLDGQTDVLALIEKAADMEVCEFEVGYQGGAGVDALDRGMAIRRLVQLNAVRCEYFVLTGQADTAAGFIDVSLKLGRIYERQPVLISELLRVSISAYVYDTIKIIIESDSISDKALAVLHDAMYGVVPYSDIKQTRRIFAGEQIYDFYFMQHHIRKAGGAVYLSDEADGFQDDIKLTKWNWFSWPIWHKRCALLLRDGQRVTGAISQAWQTTLSNMKTFLVEDHFDFGFVPKNIHVRFIETLASSQAKYDVTCLDVLVERYRLSEGVLPGNLNEVGVKFGVVLPTDPFTGEGYRYVVGDEGYVVYSVGPNGVDDGGKVDELEDDEYFSGYPDVGVRIEGVN